MPSINFEKFNQALLDWYKKNQRNLPWRHTRDPYRIWVSEIMSQQTQIERVAVCYYPRFIERFPTVQDLAQTDWETLYPYWKGLGFYRRGQNMLRCAQIIVNQYDGKFPCNLESLKHLPGVGPYTASAILAFAFDQRVPALDTNINKIISVLWPQKKLVKIAHKLVQATDQPHAWNSAMMDLAGAIRQKKTLTGDIASYFTPEILQACAPKRPPKPKQEKNKKTLSSNIRIEVGIACIHRDGQYLVQTRPEGKSFVGSWEFPGGKREPREDWRTCVKREVQEEIGVEVSVRPHFLESIHEFDDKTLVLRFHRCQIQAGEPTPREKQQLMWVEPEKFRFLNFLETNQEVLERLQLFKA